MVRKNQCPYPHASSIVLALPSPVVHQSETVDAWNLKPSRIQLGVLSHHTSCNAVSIQERAYQTATKAGRTLCPTHFVPNAPYNTANTSTRDTHKFRDPKNMCSPNKTRVADSLGCWPGLPYGIFATLQRIPKSGISPKSRDWCVLELFLYLFGSVGGAWGARFLREPAGLTPPRFKYERKPFLKS